MAQETPHKERVHPDHLRKGAGQVSKTSLPGASIIIQDAEPPLMGTVTEMDGNSLLPAVPTGRASLQVYR